MRGEVTQRPFVYLVQRMRSNQNTLISDSIIWGHFEQFTVIQDLKKFLTSIEFHSFHHAYKTRHCTQE
jgi:hypothetical protein